jgi:hypothetical protein
VSGIVDRMVERNLAVLREKKRRSLFELMTNKRAVSNSFYENTILLLTREPRRK